MFLSPESFAEDFLRSWEEKQGLSADGSGGKNRRKNNRETGRNTAKVKLPKESLQKILECLEPVPKTSETLLQEEGRIYGHFRTEPGTDGTGTFGICQTEQSGTFQHFCELTRLSEKGYSNRHMRMTRKVRCPYER